MMAAGVAMASVFFYIYSGPWQRFRQAVPAEDWGAAEQAIARIRPLVYFNLVLGSITTLVGAGGRFLA